MHRIPTGICKWCGENTISHRHYTALTQRWQPVCTRCAQAIAAKTPDHIHPRIELT